MKLRYRLFQDTDKETFSELILHDLEAQAYLGWQDGEMSLEKLKSHTSWDFTLVFYNTENKEPVAISMADARFNPQRIYLASLYVIDTYRYQGIGTQVAIDTMRFAFNQYADMDKAYTYTMEGNEAAEKINRSIGFKARGFYPEMFANGKGQRYWTIRKQDFELATSEVIDAN